jgi:hypothetical protein
MKIVRKMDSGDCSNGHNGRKKSHVAFMIALHRLRLLRSRTVP